MTEWRSIPNLPNHSASSAGEIRNDATGTIRKPHTGPNGYKIIGFHQRGSKKICRTVHALVAAAFYGPRPAGMEIRHLDGVRGNCAAANLSYGSKRDNAADRDRHGKTCRGDKHGNRIICSDDVALLRLAYAAGGVTQYELADQFGISQAQVNNIVLGKQWKSVSLGEGICGVCWRKIRPEQDEQGEG